MKLIAIALLIFGGLLCCLNFYLSFLRYAIHRLTGKKKEEYRWTSGIPIFGSLFVFLSLLANWQTHWIPVAAVILIIIDTGGIHWFFVAVIYNTFFKRNKVSNQRFERTGVPPAAHP